MKNRVRLLYTGGPNLTLPTRFILVVAAKAGGVLVSGGIQVNPQCQFDSDPAGFD